MRNKNFNIIGIFFVIIIMVGSFLSVSIIEEKKFLNFIRENKIILNQKNELYTENFKVNKLVKKGNNFYYNKLNKEEKAIYTKIANAVKHKDNAFEVNKKDYKEDFEKTVTVAMEAFLQEHPEAFYLDHGYKYIEYTSLLFDKYIFVIGYNETSPAEIDRKIDLLDFEIERIVGYIKDKNEFEKELAINNYICKNIDYDYSKKRKNAHNAYGALIEKKAVCDGLSKACSILLNRANMDSIIVTGKLKDELHAWNLVKVNGDYYHLDITSNISLKKEEGIYTHWYFNLTDEEIAKTNIMDNKDIYPKCNKTSENYYIKKGYVIDNKNNISDKVNKMISDNRNKGFIEFINLTGESVKGEIKKAVIARKDKSIKQLTYYEIENNMIVKF